VSGTVLAGAAVIDITPAVGMAMGGYGARTGVATGIHDPLCVRALVLDDGATKLALAVCDLVGVPADLVRRARELIARDCGIPADHVCVAATHTHSGPLLRTEGVEDLIALTARKICGAVRVALGRLQPVTLKVATTTVTTISQNRRHPAGPIATTATVLLAAPAGGAAPVATVVNYACHATVLEYDNLLYSADFPGAMARALEQAVGGVGIYLQGAAGNINPVWMRHDFQEVERIGGILAAAAARAVHELRPLGEGQWAVNLSWSETTPKEPAPGTVLRHVALAAARRTITAPRRALPPLEAIDRELAELEARLNALPESDREGRRALRPRVGALRMDRAQALGDPAAPGQTEPLELQAFRIADECAVVMLPGEFFVEIAGDIEREAGIRHLLVCGYANASAGYFPTPEAFPQGGYEAGRARFAPEVGPLLGREAAALVRSLSGARAEAAGGAMPAGRPAPPAQ
jgi:neutral ceramidase